MKAAEQRLPVMIGDHPNPVGFVNFGTLAEDGIKLKRPNGDQLLARGGRSVRLDLKVDFTGFDRALVGAIMGDPLALLAYQARRINPHWYLDGDDQ